MRIKKFTMIGVTPQTHDLLKRVAQLKRWQLSTLMDFFAELFSNGLDMLNDEDVDISVLRGLYENWQLGLFPYGNGSAKNE